ncbi:MAG: D-sedoheptulose 7-phosphate isomerase [Thermodesulfobacteria bacterium]|nr:D-sedoheptulose 7-phosphate isomerase [Thermodesulfobacteriota bacterium]
MKDYKNLIFNWAEESRKVQEEFINQNYSLILKSAELTKDVINAGGKLLIFGNGGSAADSQHLAAELVNRFKKERKPFPAIALTTDTSILTAVANDYSFEEVFEKQIIALGKKGDIALGISTSGNSPNVIRALKTASALGLHTIGLTGKTGGKMADCCEILIKAPSTDTPRIQECHLLFLHIFAGLVEELLT